MQGVRLAGSAFADALMVVEFLNTFGSALDLGKLVMIVTSMFYFGIL